MDKVLVALLVLFLSSHSIYAEVPTLKKNISNTKNAVVRIERAKGQFRDSGFVVSSEGYILTVSHIVSELSPDRASGKLGLRYFDDLVVSFSDGKRARARPVNKEGDKIPFLFDYAVLKVDIDDLPYLRLGSSKEVKEGEEVYFTGYPFDFGCTTHRGIVSATISLKRQLNGDNTSLDAFQIDGSVNKGNSGSPLVSCETGEVIGIVVAQAGGLSRELMDIKKQLEEALKRKDTKKKGLSPLEIIERILDILENHSTVGIGFANRIEYSKEGLKRLGILSQ